MTPVSRRTKPKVLQQNEVKWLKKLQEAINNLAILKQNPQTTSIELKKAQQDVGKAQDKYRHEKIKEALVTMFHGKCAYCESKLTHVSYGEIEHFYPKSAYPDKTFTWENLLLSCSICNNTNHKGVKFPLDEQNNPLLIDPTDGVTNPIDHLIFSWDEAALTASVYGRDLRGQTVVDIFDLNGTRGRVDLLKMRSREVKQLMTLLKFAQHGNPEALTLLTEACEADVPYRAFALNYIKPILDRDYTGYALG